MHNKYNCVAENHHQSCFDVRSAALKWGAHVSPSSERRTYKDLYGRHAHSLSILWLATSIHIGGMIHRLRTIHMQWRPVVLRPRSSADVASCPCRRAFSYRYRIARFHANIRALDIPIKSDLDNHQATASNWTHESMRASIQQQTVTTTANGMKKHFYICNEILKCFYIFIPTAYSQIRILSWRIFSDFSSKMIMRLKHRCFKQCFKCDSYCYESTATLITRHMPRNKFHASIGE